MLRLKSRIHFLLLCCVITCMGLANAPTPERDVVVLFSNNATSSKLLLKETTIMIFNGSTTPIFVPTDQFTNLFSKSIQFEFCSSKVALPKVLSVKEPQELFAPKFHKIEPDCALTRTFFWHSDMSDQFHSLLSETEYVRVKCAFFYYDANNQFKENVVVSKWLSKKKFKNGVSLVEMTENKSLQECSPFRKNWNISSFESNVEVILEEE